MTNTEPAGSVGRRTRSRILAIALVVVGAVLIGVLGYPSSAISLSSATLAQPIAPQLLDGAPRSHQGAPGAPAMDVPAGTTVFDNGTPAVANLDPKLLRALRRAATDAAGDGIRFYVNSGWRSRKEQQQLFREAVARYGSKAEAARWVATPGTSAHESGDAVDLGNSDATTWLAERGHLYGLCQIYRNETWHYELRPDAVSSGCPPMYADPTQDPRLHR